MYFCRKKNSYYLFVMVRIILILLMHAAGDFVLQGSVLSKLKAYKTAYLFAHVGIYTTFFLVLSPVFLGLSYIQSLQFSLLNGGAHLIVDFVTSKLKKLYWEKKNENAFVAVISFDHITHLTCLFTSYILMFPVVFENSKNLYYFI